MTQAWTVEEALIEVAAAIDEGSRLSIENVRAKYKELYEVDFNEQYVAGADWENDRGRVLLLARLVGSLATAFTYWKAALKNSPVPVQVDPESAYLAGYLVSKVVCALGAYCDDYDPTSFTPNEQVANRLAQSFRSFSEDLTPLLSA